MSIYIVIHSMQIRTVQRKWKVVCSDRRRHGKIGTEFLKATVWMGQMKSLDLEIYMIDLKGNLRRKSLSARCPELLQEDSDYQIDIHKGNIFSKKIELYLNELKDINYCMVSLGEDEKSLRAALAPSGDIFIADIKRFSR